MVGTKTIYKSRFAKRFIYVTIQVRNCPFHEMDKEIVHFTKWTNPYIFCYPFHKMDKVMYESLTFIHGQSFGLIYHVIPL